MYFDRDGLKVPMEEGGRETVCDVGSSTTGFLEGCKLGFRHPKKSSNPDYNSDLNASVFKNWFI
jgi:hypothetical protein